MPPTRLRTTELVINEEVPTQHVPGREAVPRALLFHTIRSHDAAARQLECQRHRGVVGEEVGESSDEGVTRPLWGNCNNLSLLILFINNNYYIFIYYC